MIDVTLPATHSICAVVGSAAVHLVVAVGRGTGVLVHRKRQMEYSSVQRSNDS
jgi:hypothetical protein